MLILFLRAGSLPHWAHREILFCKNFTLTNLQYITSTSLKLLRKVDAITFTVNYNILFTYHIPNPAETTWMLLPFCLVVPPMAYPHNQLLPSRMSSLDPNVSLSQEHLQDEENNHQPQVILDTLTMGCLMLYLQQVVSCWFLFVYWMLQQTGLDWRHWMTFQGCYGKHSPYRCFAQQPFSQNDARQGNLQWMVSFLCFVIGALKSA